MRGGIPFYKYKTYSIPILGNKAFLERVILSEVSTANAVEESPTDSYRSPDHGNQTAAHIVIPTKRCAWRGAKEAIALWAILRSRKRPERVNRNKQCDALQASSAPIEIADIPYYAEGV